MIVATARATARYRDLRLAGLCLFILAGQFLTVIMLAAGIAPDYNMSTGAISDLGVIGETALLFNVSVVAVGVLNILGGYLFFRSHRRLWLLALFAVAGVGAIGVGFFPLNRGGIHSLFALVAFLFFNVEALGVAAVLRGPLKALSVIAGVLGLTFIVAMVLGDGGMDVAFGPIGHGGTERMIVYPAMLWMLALGGSLMTAQGGDAQPGRA